MSLLEDLLSQDPQRIWSGSCAVRTLRDPKELELLISHLDEIKTSTHDVPLGGALRPNSSHLAFALRKLEILRDSHPCLCTLYPLDELYNPIKEEQAGNVTILETVSNAAEWTTVYQCQCRLCGARYRVEEGEYHYTWWSWKPVAPPVPPPLPPLP